MNAAALDRGAARFDERRDKPDGATLDIEALDAKFS